MFVGDLLRARQHSPHCLSLTSLAEDRLVAGRGCLVGPAPGLAVGGGEEAGHDPLVLVLPLTVENISKKSRMIK